jgi:hypothetical protein
MPREVALEHRRRCRFGTELEEQVRITYIANEESREG